MSEDLFRAPSVWLVATPTELYRYAWYLNCACCSHIIVNDVRTCYMQKPSIAARTEKDPNTLDEKAMYQNIARTNSLIIIPKFEPVE